MAISWGTIKSILLFFGPILLPKAIGYYRSVRAAPRIHGVSIRPIPPSVQRALFVLFIVAISFLIKALPTFAPQNIFSITQSRLQIPNDTLFARLSALRPKGLTADDKLLQSKLSSLDSRLQYFRFGPAVLTECLFCNHENPNTYLYYALPSLLIPHMFNLCILTLVTSGIFTGKEVSIWRTTGTLAALGLAALDVYFVSAYSFQDNARATRVQDLDFFFWKMRIYRYLSLSALDASLGYLLYLSSTNRAFLSPPTTAERIEMSTKILDMARSKMSAAGILRNSIVRSEALRVRSNEYWVHEGLISRQIMEDREVVESVQNALENRLDVVNIQRDADTYAGNILESLQEVLRRQESVSVDT